MSKRSTMKVTVKETGEEILVNRTPKALLRELEKHEDKRDHAFVNSQNEHEPYYDPNVHDLIEEDDEDDEEPAAAAEPKRKAAPKSRKRVAVKPAAEDTLAAPALADDDEDEDDED